jgi:hypothetical protein
MLAEAAGRGCCSHGAGGPVDDIGMAALALMTAMVIWKLIFNSPAIEMRLQGDPYDDGLMDDFGPLAEHFYDGEKKVLLN